MGLVRAGATAGLLLAGVALGGVALGGAASAQVPVDRAGDAPSGATSAQASLEDWGQRAGAFGDLEWVTRPSRDTLMSFTIPTEIASIPVKPGDRVGRGQVLVQGRDDEPRAALAVQRVRAGNDGEVRQARAALDLAQVRLKRIKEADQQGAGTPQEMDERRVGVEVALAALLGAEQRLAEERARVAQLEESVGRYRLTAPFDGVVEAVFMDEGQIVEPPAPVVRIVSVNPMWIELPVPTQRTLAEGLAAGKAAWVMLDVPGAPVVRASVLHVSPVADAAAETRRVRVEVPNPAGLPPGTRARVRFSEPATQTVGQGGAK